MSPKPRRVYSYIRFSTPEQAAGHSLQRQMDYARNYAAENGLILDESLTLRDEGLSAFHRKNITKGALGTFLKAVDDGKVLSGSVLILEGLDRLSRAEPIQSQAVLSQIVNAGISVITASDNKVYDRESLSRNPMDLVYSLLVMIRAHEESATKAKRVKQAFRGQINQWIDTGKGPIIRIGSDPFWVVVNESNDGFELVQEMADAVNIIISKYKKGWGLLKIARYLNDNVKHHEQHYTKNKFWNCQAIADLLRSKSLIGERYFNIDDGNFVIHNYYPSILSNEEFSELQYLIRTRATTKAQSSIPSLVTGMKLSYCGYCSYGMVAQNFSYRKSKDGNLSKGLRRMRCSCNNYGVRCKTNGKSVSVVNTEKALLRYCSDNMDFSAIMGEDDNRKELQIKASQARSELDEISEKIDRMVNQFATMEKVPAIFVKKVNDLEEQQTKLAAKYESMKADLSVSVDDNEDVAERWKLVSSKAEDMDEEARLMIRQLIKRTFAKINIYLFGMDGEDTNNTIDLVLTFHNGVSRILEIDKNEGSFIIKNDYQES